VLTGDVCAWYTVGMPRPTVLLDCDGVLANFTRANLDYLRTLGVDRSEDEVTTWEIGEALGLEPHQRAQMKARWSEPGFALDLPIYAGAQEGVRELFAAGADVVVVTSPMTSSRTWHGDRERWLREHFGIEPDHVIHAAGDRKALVRGDLLVEDRPETLEAWIRENPNGHGVLWHRAYNARAGVGRGIARCYPSHGWRYLLDVTLAMRLGERTAPRWAGEAFKP